MREFPSPVLIRRAHIDIHTFYQYHCCIEMPVWMHMRTFSQSAIFLNDRTSEADRLPDGITISWTSRSSAFWHRAVTQLDIDVSEENAASHRIQLGTKFTQKSISFTKIYTLGRVRKMRCCLLNSSISYKPVDFRWAGWTSDHDGYQLALVTFQH